MLPCSNISEIAAQALRDLTQIPESMCQIWQNPLKPIQRGSTPIANDRQGLLTIS